MKILRNILILIALFITILFAQVYAHSGRTDSNGGHWDYSTGTYHYHNDGETITGSFSDSSNNNNDSEELDFQIEHLETQIEEKEKIVSNLYDLSNKQEDEIKKLKTYKSNSYIIYFVLLIAILISYSVGFNKRQRS